MKDKYKTIKWIEKNLQFHNRDIIKSKVKYNSSENPKHERFDEGGWIETLTIKTEAYCLKCDLTIDSRFEALIEHAEKHINCEHKWEIIDVIPCWYHVNMGCEEIMYMCKHCDEHSEGHGKTSEHSKWREEPEDVKC